MVLTTVLVAVLMMDMVLAVSLETRAFVPSGEMDTHVGQVPTVMVLLTVLVDVLITETVLAPSFTT